MEGAACRREVRSEALVIGMNGRGCVGGNVSAKGGGHEEPEDEAGGRG
jgi:hypothetical protein